MTERLTYSPEQEQEPGTVPPSVYLADFQKSRLYQHALKARLSILRRERGRVNVAGVKQDFPATDQYRDALWQFFQKYPLHFEPSLYNNETLMLLEDYWRQTRELMAKERLFQLDRDQLINLDNERSVAHLRASQSLVNTKEVPNERVGRLIVHFLTVDQGIEPKPRKDSDERRREVYRQIGWS